MKTIRILKVLLTSLSLVALIGMQPSLVHAKKGFADDSSKNIVGTGTGECLHTQRWKASMGDCGKVEAKKPKPMVKKPRPMVKKQEPISITVGDVHFDFDKATLKDSARSVLDDAASQITAAGASPVSITGYTDSTGPAAYNQGLSERRANSVKAYLEGKGVGNVSASGAGEANPVADNGTKDGRAQNRRVEIQAGN